MISKKLVDFVIAGAQKSGTTALKGYLELHESIAFSSKKEAHFFDYPFNIPLSHSLPNRLLRKAYSNPLFNRLLARNLDYSAYHEMYGHASEDQIWGDKTPDYMFFSPIPRLLWRYNSDMKIVIILRNPVDRAYSHYQMMIRNEVVKWEFEDLLKGAKGKFFKSAQIKLGDSICRRGLYVEQIKRLQRYFPDNQMHFIKFEQLKNDSQLTLDKVFSFLNLDKKRIPAGYSPAHVRSYKPLDASVKSYLSRIYYPEIERLGPLLNWDCSDWLEDMKPYLNPPGKKGPSFCNDENSTNKKQKR